MSTVSPQNAAIESDKYCPASHKTQPIRYIGIFPQHRWVKSSNRKALCRFLYYTYCIKIVVLLTFRLVFVKMSVFLDCSHYSDQSNTTFLFIRIVQSSLPRLFGRTKKPVCLPQTGSYVLFMFTSPHVLPFDVRFALRRPRVLPHTGCTVCKTRNLRSAAPSMLRSNSALHCTQSNPFFLHSFRSHPSFQIPTRVCEPFYGVHSGSVHSAVNDLFKPGAARKAPPRSAINFRHVSSPICVLCVGLSCRLLVIDTVNCPFSCAM